MPSVSVCCDHMLKHVWGKDANSLLLPANLYEFDAQFTCFWRSISMSLQDGLHEHFFWLSRAFLSILKIISYLCGILIESLLNFCLWHPDCFFFVHSHPLVCRPWLRRPIWRVLSMETPLRPPDSSGDCHSCPAIINYSRVPISPLSPRQKRRVGIFRSTRLIGWALTAGGNSISQRIRMSGRPIFIEQTSMFRGGMTLRCQARGTFWASRKTAAWNMACPSMWTRGSSSNTT